MSEIGEIECAADRCRSGERSAIRERGCASNALGRFCPVLSKRRSVSAGSDGPPECEIMSHSLCIGNRRINDTELIRPTHSHIRVFSVVFS